MNPLTDDDRNRLLRATATSSRKNRPRWMVSLGIAAVAIAALYAWLGWSGTRAANRELAAARAGDQRLAAVLEEVRALQQPPESGDQDWCDQTPGWQTMVEEAADRVGLDRPSPPSFERPQKVSDQLSRNIFRYSDVRAPSAEPLLAWLAEVEGTIECMRVHSLDIQAVGQTGWRATVTFSRLEKTS
ncbi:MAG: hypothetical protein AAGF47_04365 [Planctomycetota bacterium]